MSDRPIIFSGPMVRAILEGRKTQTRRVIKPQPECDVVAGMFGMGDHGCFYPNYDLDRRIICPYGHGPTEYGETDRLWVRETWRPLHYLETAVPDGMNVQYRADLAYGPGGAVPSDYRIRGKIGAWKPSIHMPKWAARLWLRVESVRVERLQDLTETAAISEGCCNAYHPNFHTGAFRDLWDSINAKRGFPWADNPWVWVVTFEREAQE